MLELIKKTLSIARISMHGCALNDAYVYHFLIHKPASHKTIAHCLWHGDSECLVFEMDKFIRIQVSWNAIFECPRSLWKKKMNFDIFFRMNLCIRFAAARWRKHRRQYLSKMLRPFSSIGAITAAPAQTNGPILNNTSFTSTHLHRRLEFGSNDMESEFNSTTFLEESSSLGGTGDTSDSKDSQHIKEDIGKCVFILTPHPLPFQYLSVFCLLWNCEIKKTEIFNLHCNLKNVFILFCFLFCVVIVFLFFLIQLKFPETFKLHI